jgi:hypothetical protein
MTEAKRILSARLEKLEKNFEAIRSYKLLIDALSAKKDIFNGSVFVTLVPEEKALFDAYLKRFASIQDFLGSKIFPLLLEISGIVNAKMSEVLIQMEKEEIIDNLDSWIELREKRNNLEHDYPDDLEDALRDLRFCVDSLSRLESYYARVIAFTRRYGA